MDQFPSEEQLRNTRDVTLAKDGTAKPESGTSWLVLFGGIYHITGTNTYLKVFRDSVKDEHIIGMAYVSTSSGTAPYPLFSLLASTLMQASMNWFVIHDTDVLQLTGGTGVLANLRVVVF